METSLQEWFPRMYPKSKAELLAPIGRLDQLEKRVLIRKFCGVCVCGC